MKASKTIGQRELPDEYYTAIGRVLVHWGWLEHRAHEATWHLLPTNRKTARMITSEMDFRALTKVLASLAGRRIRDASVASRVSRLANEIQANLDTRNRLIHGAWGWNGKEAVVLEYRGTPIKGRPHVYDLERLNQFLDSIQQKRSRLQQLLKNVPIGEPPPSPGKRAKRARDRTVSHRTSGTAQKNPPRSSRA